MGLGMVKSAMDSLRSRSQPIELREVEPFPPKVATLNRNLGKRFDWPETVCRQDYTAASAWENLKFDSVWKSFSDRTISATSLFHQHSFHWRLQARWRPPTPRDQTALAIA
jgi:hypothetical protein